MPELIALTTAFRTDSKYQIAANAARELEQYGRKTNSPYWNITAASANIDTVEKLTGNTETANVEEDADDLLVHEFGTSEADALLDAAFSETIEQTQDKLDRMASTLSECLSSPDDENTASAIEHALTSEDTVRALLQDDGFIYAAADIGDRFGTVYRVYDLTGWRHGHPVRSREMLDEVRKHHNSKKGRQQALYVVKLLARSR